MAFKRSAVRSRLSPPERSEKEMKRPVFARKQAFYFIRIKDEHLVHLCPQLSSTSGCCVFFPIPNATASAHSTLVPI